LIIDVKRTLKAHQRMINVDNTQPLKRKNTRVREANMLTARWRETLVNRFFNSPRASIVLLI
jgi:hypothetical protein